MGSAEPLRHVNSTWMKHLKPSKPRERWAHALPFPLLGFHVILKLY